MPADKKLSDQEKRKIELGIINNKKELKIELQTINNGDFNVIKCMALLIKIEMLEQNAALKTVDELIKDSVVSKENNKIGKIIKMLDDLHNNKTPVGKAMQDSRFYFFGEKAKAQRYFTENGIKRLVSTLSDQLEYHIIRAARLLIAKIEDGKQNENYGQLEGDDESKWKYMLAINPKLGSLNRDFNTLPLPEPMTMDEINEMPVNEHGLIFCKDLFFNKKVKVEESEEEIMEQGIVQPINKRQ